MLGGTKVKINFSNDGVGFLGVWINNNADFKFHNICIESTVKMINIMRRKKLTAKECIYLWNSVVIAMVEYQLQCTVLKEVLLYNLDSRIRNLIKSKCNLATYTNNAIIHDKDFLDFKSHSNDKGKDMADALSKTGSLENNDNSEIFININDEVTWEYLAYWRRILIKEKEFRSDISWNNDEYVAFNIKNYLEILSMDTYLDL
ncbi:hypothetical protein RhiirA4_480137 [Rhizophagus irregularis]|uniref:Uncharacterized protein n=1 Tax=Rhizophagus irregularis TaxID=588596 RepID=A0A2I1HHH5_9GLOM|nr:hypothetical protein RhiirA4_480137 [Rhizophagus irregularis]